MPTIPMIVPLLVTGISFGYILRTKKASIGRRLIALGCLLGGAGNAVNAAILYLFQSQATTGRNFPPGANFARQGVPTQSPVVFVLLAFLVGVLIVLLVLIPATLIQTRKLSFLQRFSRKEEKQA
jgi:hypothetical protein